MQQVNFPLRTAESSSRSSMGIWRWGVIRVKKQVALKLWIYTVNKAYYTAIHCCTHRSSGQPPLSFRLTGRQIVPQ